MPAPSLCTITGTLRKANGAVWPNGQLTISRAASTSQVLGGTSVIITADASGAVSFSLVQGSIVTISGAFVIGKDAGVDYDFSRGLRIFVPVQSSATLEALKTIEDELAAISAPTTDAIEVQEAGVSLGSFTALNFATGATVTDAGGGVADVDITGGGGGGSVSSVFGRTGAVVAATNDYTFAQIDKTTSSLADLTTRSAADLSSGTLPDARFPATLPALSGANLTALNASNLASGTVPLARLSGITTTELSGSAGITSAQLAGSIAITKIAITGTPDGTKFLRDDASWQTIPGGGDALTSNPLSQFAATTSAQLAGVLSDETGFTTGALAVFSKSPTIETPTIASFTNATHDHSNAAGGGQIAISAGISGLGTGVAAALGVNVGSAGAPVLFNGAGGTPSSLTLTNATGLPLSTGVTGDLPFANFVQAGSAGFVGATGAGDYSHRTPTQVTAALDAFTGDSGSGGVKGLVPAPAAGDAAAGKFLKADGTFAVPSGGGGLTVGTTTITGGSDTDALYNNSGVLGSRTVTGSGNAVLSTSPTITTPAITTSAIVTRDSLGTTNATGVELINNTAAAAGAQQISPDLTWTAQGWKTNATAASQMVNWKAYVLPVQGTTAPTANWVLQNQINGGGYSDRLTVTSSGLVIATNTTTSGATTYYALGAATTTGFGGRSDVSQAAILSGGTVNQVWQGGVIRMVSSATFGFASGSAEGTNLDLTLRRSAAASLAFGAADAASPVAQTLSVQNVVAGTSNTAGANWTLNGSRGTGTGAGGSLIFQVAPPSATGTTQNSLATAFTLASTSTTLTVPTPVQLTTGAVAGYPVAITASAATASSSTVGAAAGGSVTITTGNAARLTSGNANGGDIVLATGTGIGTGHQGQVLLPAGVTANPALAPATDVTTGINLASGTLNFIRSGTLTATLVSNGWSLPFTSGNFGVNSDTGLTRQAAAVWRMSNNSTGAGSLVLGTSTVGSIGTSGVGVLAIANGTAPGSSPADEFQLYSADWNGAGTAAAHFRNEEGHIIKLARAATYTPTNVTTDRSYDANATTLDEVADVLGTLIADLQTLGFLG